MPNELLDFVMVLLNLIILNKISFMKIYTKTGDLGKTSLFNGQRLPKDDIRIECYGTVDELNANIGLVLSSKIDQVTFDFLSEIQTELFIVGSYLATPIEHSDRLKLNAFSENFALRIEREIDRMDAILDPLTAFVMPSGSVEIAYCHLCRTVCRRAERRVVTLANCDEINPNILIYLNRLSDYFFTLSRYVSKINSVAEKFWIH